MRSRFSDVPALPEGTGVTEPVEPELRRRLIPAVWGRTQMPKDLSREEAVEYARARAVEERLTYVLVWSRMEEIWCYPEGTTLVRMMEVGEAAVARVVPDPGT